MLDSRPADDGKRLEAHFSEQHAMDVVCKTQGKNGGGFWWEGSRNRAGYGGPADDGKRVGAPTVALIPCLSFASCKGGCLEGGNGRDGRSVLA